MSDFYSLRECKLPEALAAKLAPFISAHRPHDEIVDKSELGDRIPKEEDTLSEIQRLTTHRSFYRQEYLKDQNRLAYQILSELHYEEETQ